MLIPGRRRWDQGGCPGVAGRLQREVLRWRAQWLPGADKAQNPRGFAFSPSSPLAGGKPAQPEEASASPAEAGSTHSQGVSFWHNQCWRPSKGEPPVDGKMGHWLGCLLMKWQGSSHLQPEKAGMECWGGGNQIIADFLKPFAPWLLLHLSVSRVCPVYHFLSPLTPSQGSQVVTLQTETGLKGLGV